jgi:hypothetical protein
MELKVENGLYIVKIDKAILVMSRDKPRHNFVYSSAE